MPFYLTQGNIPKKRHTVFNNPNGEKYYEELVSREGFSSIYSNLYHLYRPTKVKEVGQLEKKELIHCAKKHRHRHIRTDKLKSSGDAVNSRTTLFFNDDIIISIVNVSKPMRYCYRNGIGDEVLYIQSGVGILITNLGTLECNPGDYVVIPRGIIWQLNPKETMRILIIDSIRPIETPSRYRNRFGVAYCHRRPRHPGRMPSTEPAQHP